MKSLLIFATLFVAFTVYVNAKPHRPLPPHKKAAFDACMKKHDITEEQLHEHFRRKGSAEEEKPFDCFFACVDKETGLINAEGNIDREVALKDFPPHVSQEERTTIIDACIEQKGADDCETSKLYKTCVRKLRPRPPMHPELQKLHDECKEKLNLSDEDIKKMKHPKEDVKKDCFRACVDKGIGFLNEDGTFNKEVFVEKSPAHLKERSQTVAEECAKEEAADECETAILLHKCFKKNDFRVGDLFGPPRHEHDLA